LDEDFNVLWRELFTRATPVYGKTSTLAIISIHASSGSAWPMRSSRPRSRIN